mgnify:CR=1 FL=1
MSDTRTRKISVALTDEAAQTVEEMAAKNKIPVSELVRRAIALEKFIEDELAEGSTVMIRRKNGDLERVQFVFG